MGGGSERDDEGGRGNREYEELQQSARGWLNQEAEWYLGPNHFTRCKTSYSGFGRSDIDVKTARTLTTTEKAQDFCR